MRISGSNVLLTGATGGIGHAIAQAVADRGGKLIVTGRRGDLLEQLATEFKARPLTVDLSAPDDVVRLAQEAGDVDILIANAALPASGTLDSFTVKEIDRALDVNLRAPMVLAHELAPRMAANGGGHLLFMSSLLGKAAMTGTSVYSATKYGLRGFAASLRADLREAGVGVSVVFPGMVREAGMFADAKVDLPPGTGTSSPEEVAHAVVTAIEKNRGEIDVAPLTVRAVSMFAGLAPELAAGLTRRIGADKVTAKVAEGQRDKR
ncbi:SDR family oxidoreductase [Mycobacterium sp. ITM-2016-00318]|uniref:SDR family NAD(P)-dependent oxidoreductase n=1 Tax=Mycobacterium sp. ITM-2016-00318 TaxID=2099693 RepID=UPI000CFA4D1D|nr:SDR family NAD(P)-dependent oxidoreductase [Mycobacterium sp. ITM-2016-00318]WNG92256.1 SDR family NAD(P)-dependent oxidoreductase [Mycobacterium sp. ITM-2016-00318]